MPRLLLILALAAIVYILYQRARNQAPHKRRAEYIKLGLVVAVALVIVLTVTGRMHWVGAALTGLLVIGRQLLPLLLRYFPALASLKSNRSQGAQQSTVESALLRMHLDHESGNLSGEVLQGRFQGWYLDELERPQLDELMQFCRQQDEDSAQLLQGYLDQRFPGGDQQADSDDTQKDQSSAMTRSEALSILGLGEDAVEEDVIKAHRTLMQKLHPDRGGSDYLAAKINAAKDYLLR